MSHNGPPEFLESLAELRRLKAEGKWKPRIEFRYYDPNKREQITYKGERDVEADDSFEKKNLKRNWRSG